MSEYRTLFDARGARYNLANRLYPEARAQEAEQLLAHLDLASGRWLDVGAGGGFLSDRAAASGRVTAPVPCDESVAFLAEADGYRLRTVAHYERLPFVDRSFSAAGCLAVLHHAERPDRVIAEMVRVTSPGGRVAVGDVAALSRAATFLNGFVDAYAETGHAGRFYEPPVFADMLERAGGREVRVDRVEVEWRFGCRSDAHLFCRDLFGLRPDTERRDLERALEDLGLGERGGECRLPWSMVFASAAAP